MLSKLYLTVSGIVIHSFKLIGHAYIKQSELSVTDQPFAPNYRKASL